MDRNFTRPLNRPISQFRPRLGRHVRGADGGGPHRTPGSAGYVAIEHFTGSVAGRSGSFVLQHSGLTDRGDAALTVTIVPDSGTGKLAGISGTLEIGNEVGTHSYVLEYEHR